MTALKALPWFPSSVREIRAFRLENYSEFTDFMSR
jgi:virulence-associated protein VapD